MNEHASGWYEHNGERRYWDGSQWTHSTSLPPTSGAPTSATPPAPTSGAVSPYTPPPVYGASTAYGPPPGAPQPQQPMPQQPMPQQSMPPAGMHGHPYPGGVLPARKEPALSLLMSFFIPGVGSMINGDVGAGVAFLLVYGLGLGLVICLGVFIVGLIGLPIALGAWAWSLYHAYQGAVDYNRAVGYAG